jgi:hypothetical protein
MVRATHGLSQYCFAVDGAARSKVQRWPTIAIYIPPTGIINKQRATNPCRKSGAKSSAATAGIASQLAATRNANPGFARVYATVEYDTQCRVGDKGLEQPQDSSGNMGVSEIPGTESGTPGAQSGTVAPNLAAIIEALATLPPDVQQALAAALQEGRVGAK